MLVQIIATENQASVFVVPSSFLPGRHFSIKLFITLQSLAVENNVVKISGSNYFKASIDYLFKISIYLQSVQISEGQLIKISR